MNSIIDEVLTKDSKNVNKLPDLDRSTDKANNTVDICESIKSRESIFAIATEESKNVCPQEEEEENINTPTMKVDETIFKTDEFEETAAKKLKTVIHNDKNINPTINKEYSESKYNKRDDDIVKKELEEQAMVLSNINLDREFVIINEENHKRETGDKNRQSYGVSEPASEEDTEDFKEEVEGIEITGDQEIYEIIDPKANGTKAEDLTDDENKEQFISEKTLFEDVEDEKKFKIEATMYEKETSKNCDVEEKYENSRDNKSFLNNDVLYLYDSSSKYSEEDETEFITLKEDELNTIHDLYKSTSINSNVFESLKSTERIIATATEEIKPVRPQEEEQINAGITKIYETIVNIQENNEKAANNSKTIVDNDKNIKVEEIEILGDEELDKTILPDENDDGEDSDYNYQKPQSNYLSTVLLQPETTNTTVYSTSSSSPYPNSNSITSSGLIRKRQHEEDEDDCIQDKSKTQKHQVKSDERSFVQSIATRSQRLTTSGKRFKRSTKAGINAPPQRIRLNVTTAATVTSIAEYTENNDGEDLLQATWIENDETQISDDDEPKKQQQQQTEQQDHYSSSSSASTSSIFSERLHKRNREEIITGDDDNNETNDNPSLVSALVFPKNVDPQMFINDKNKYRCVICNQNFNSLVYHYVNEHCGCEVYNSRLSPSQIKLVKEGRCDVINGYLYKSGKHYEAFCIFCQENLRLIPRYWYNHFTRHTGEFAYRCTGCGLRKPIRDFREHQAQGCATALVKQEYFCLKTFPIEANVCNLCNYLQLHRSNIEKHLHTQHNIEQILPEHLQTISLLSLPTSMTATSTGSNNNSRRCNKSDPESSLPSSSHASNTCVINNDDNDDIFTFDQILPEESSPASIPSKINNTFKEFTNSYKATGNLNNNGGSPSLLLHAHAEKNQEGIIIGDDDENNDNLSLVSALGFPKNVDPKMVTNDENKDRCVICNEDFIGRLVYHYVNEHRGCEIYNSRLSLSQIKLAKKGYCEVFSISIYKSRKHYKAFCIFCQKNLLSVLPYWYEHFTRHTGEFAYRCTGCGLRKPRRPAFRRHQAQGCSKSRVVQDYFRSSKSSIPIPIPIEANVCNLCNYVQLHRSNIERHLHMQHNIKNILPEHIQTISLLSIPKTMPALSTGSKIDSSRWNKSGNVHSLPSISHASNTYVIDDNDEDEDNDVTFGKILPEETPPQTNPPTIKKNTFEEFISCNKATGDLINSDGSNSLLLRSHVEKNKEEIIFGDDDDKEEDNPSLVSVHGWPKNIDLQMYFSNENKYRCVICNKDFTSRLVQHYVNEHRGCEIYNSRLCSSLIKLVKQGLVEVSNVSVYKKRRYYEAFCIFCQKNLRFILRYWYDHFTRHTGEFAYRCTGCGLRKPNPDFRKHQDQANFCNLCNYVQLERSNIERHLHMQHNIKNILPEHIQAIVLLAIPTTTTATSTLSLPSSSLTSINNDDKDYHKILPEESSLQTNPPIINKNKFKKFTKYCRTTRHLSNVDTSPSLSLLSEGACNTYVIDNDDKDSDNNVTFEKIVKRETTLQANSATINKTFEESSNSHTVICSKVITLADVSSADA